MTGRVLLSVLVAVVLAVICTGQLDIQVARECTTQYTTAFSKASKHNETDKKALLCTARKTYIDCLEKVHGSSEGQAKEDVKHYLEDNTKKYEEECSAASEMKLLTFANLLVVGVVATVLGRRF